MNTQDKGHYSNYEHLGGGNYYLPLITDEKPPVPTADSARAIFVKVLIAVACIPLAGVLIGMAYAWWAK